MPENTASIPIKFEKWHLAFLVLLLIVGYLIAKRTNG